MVLDGLVDALTALLEALLTPKTCFENLETAMLCVDEVVDGAGAIPGDGRERVAQSGPDARRRGRPAHHGHDGRRKRLARSRTRWQDDEHACVRRAP